MVKVGSSPKFSPVSLRSLDLECQIGKIRVDRQVSKEPQA